MTKKLNIDPINTWINDDSDPLIISGPCSAETFDQLYETCKQLKSYGINIMRAGVWKPRTRPGTFEGNGEEALKWISDLKKDLDVQFTVEVANTNHIDLALKYGIDKTRPNGDCCESFPSGHTSIAFSGATFLAQRYGHKMVIPAYIMASFVGYSRVYADKHYWEDVLAGAAIGYGLTSLCTKEYIKISYMPYINRSDYGIFISININ